MKNLSGIALCAFICFGMTGCNESSSSGSSQNKSVETYYTKYNFHYTVEKSEIRGSVANWTQVPDHKILPYGSEVKVKKGGHGFYLTDVKSGTKINVYSKSKFLAHMDMKEYWNTILSETSVVYPDLSKADRKGIEDGRAYEGMSKKGVMIALGYPCPHRTPSPDSNVWTYWENRYGNYTVSFSNDVVLTSGY